MIPRAHVTAWRERAPWSDDALVEQDLVLSRALVDLYSDARIQEELAFRGGTALHKLVFPQALRYSEDLDLVQLRPGPIGPLLKAIHARLDPWLGVPRTRRSTASHKLIYTIETESEPRARRKLKIEIQTREHFTVRGVAARVHVVDNPWFSGECTITTYEQDELLGTKLRALYQRRKGRDLFDLEQALERLDLAEAGVVECFQRYTEEKPIRRAEFERNLAAKLTEPAFLGDMTPLLALGRPWSPVSAARLVQERLIARLPGQSWRGSGEEPPMSG